MSGETWLNDDGDTILDESGDEVVCDVCPCGEAGCEYCGASTPSNLTVSLSNVVPHEYTYSGTTRAAYGYDFSAVVCANVLASGVKTCVWMSALNGDGSIVASAAQYCNSYGPARWQWRIVRTATAYEVSLVWGTTQEGVFSGFAFGELVATIAMASGCGAANGSMDTEAECLATGYSTESYGRPIDTADIAITVGP